MCPHPGRLPSPGGASGRGRLALLAEARRSVPGHFQACSASSGPWSPCSSFLSLQCPLPLSLARLLLVLLRNDCQASRQQRLNWFCCLSAHLCKKTVKSTPPGSLLPVASQDLRIKSILSPWHPRPPDQALSRILSHHSVYRACGRVYTAPHAQISGCAIGVGRPPHPHRACSFFVSPPSWHPLG